MVLANEAQPSTNLFDDRTFPDFVRFQFRENQRIAASERMKCNASPLAL